MTFERSLITSENDAKLNWDVNNAVSYVVVNKDSLSKSGEMRGFKLQPGTYNHNYLTVKDSSNLGESVNWATHHLYATQQHDTETHSVYPYNTFDPQRPVVNYGKFFNGESLDEEDIVM